MIGYLIIYSAGVPLYYLGVWVVRQWFGDAVARPGPAPFGLSRQGVSGKAASPYRGERG